MDFLQTVWTALTTQNEMLIQIIGIPFTFIEAFVYMLLFTSVLNINATKKQKLTYVISFSIITIILNTFIPRMYSSFLLMVICPVLIIFIFKVGILKAIVCEFLPMIVSTIFEMLYLKLCFVLFNFEYNLVASIPIYRESIVILIYLSIFAISKLCKYYHLNIHILDTIDKHNKRLLIVNLVLAIVSIAMQFVIITYFNNTVPFFITIISIISLLAYFFISLYSISRSTQLQIATQNLEESKLYNKSLKILHDNVRAFKHDFSNIVQAIGGYISVDDMDGLKTYYSELLEDCQKVNNLYTLSPDVINNPAIYSILASKYHKADELGINIDLEVFLNLNELHMKIYEFTRILGILMDNAIEASSECEEKMIHVEIRKDFRSERQLLVIENTYLEKDVNIDRIFEKGYSSKPNNTGLGLWEIRQILKKNQNLNLYTSKTDTLFKQQLEIYPEEK